MGEGRTVLKRWSLVIYGTDEDINSNDNSKLGSSSPPSSNSKELTRGSSNNPVFLPALPKSSPSSPSPPSLRNPVRESSGGSAAATAKVSPKNLLPKSPSVIKEAEIIEIDEGQGGKDSSYASNVSNNETAPFLFPTSQPNRKPSRQRQNKGKNLTKKQKVATSVPPLVMKGLESHVIITSNEREFRRLLNKLSVNQTYSSSVRNGTSSEITLNNKSRDATTVTSTTSERNVTLSGLNNMMMTTSSSSTAASPLPTHQTPLPVSPTSFPASPVLSEPSRSIAIVRNISDEAEALRNGEASASVANINQTEITETGSYICSLD
jgi:hypothetical protein